MKKLVWLLAAPFLASPLWAADLLQVYREAQNNDATFAAAKSILEAGQRTDPAGARRSLADLVARCQHAVEPE